LFEKSLDVMTWCGKTRI